MPQTIYLDLFTATQALADGRIWLWSPRAGRYWQARRNGKTKTWARRPGEFRIPIKAGFRLRGELTDMSSVEVDPNNPNRLLVG